MQRRVAGVLTGLLLVLGIGMALAGLPPGGTFTDDDGNTHEGNIEAVAAAGITLGCNPDGTLYCPKQDVTRAQMATFLVRALSLPAVAGNRFSDVSGTHLANINALSEAGVTLGCNAEGTLFCPNDGVTRSQMASFLARALSLPPSVVDWFTDDDGISHEANINAVADAGITLGCQTGLYCPADLVPRDQMASFLARGLELDPIIPPPTTTTTLSLPKTGNLKVIAVQFDAPGNDNENPNGEWVDIRNDDTATVDMTGWRLEDEGPNSTYNFPAGFTLAPGVTVRIFVGVGVDTATSLYWGLGSAVWNNGGDTASLFDSSGMLIDSLTQ